MIVYRIRPVILIVVTIGIWLVSCTQTHQNRSYLIGTPCTAPCWEDITPGKTNETEVLRSIGNPNLVVQDSIRTTSIPAKDAVFFGYRFQLVSDDFVTVWLPNVDTNENVVSQIDIKPRGLQFGDVIESYGIPNNIQVEDWTQTITCYSVTLFYPDRGVLILVQGCPDEGSPINLTSNGLIVPNNARLDQILFYEPHESLRNVLVGSLQYNELYADYIIGSIQTRKGFDFPYRVDRPFQGSKY